MITPIEILRSRVTPLLRADVDTDQMIAKQYLRRLTRTGYGDALFAEWRKDPSFVLNDRRYDGSEILLAGPNFGCGSAREHAVWGLIDYGFRAVVAPSFAGSFYLNAISSGLLPAQITFTEYLELAEVAASRGLSTMTIDLPGQWLSVDQFRFSFEITPHAKEVLGSGLDDIDRTGADVDRIREFAKHRSAWMPLLRRSDPTATHERPVEG